METLDQCRSALARVTAERDRAELALHRLGSAAPVAHIYRNNVCLGCGRAEATCRAEQADPATLLRGCLAALAQRPIADPLVQELVRATRALARDGAVVLTHGHGAVTLEFAHGRYIRPELRLRGPEDKEP